MRGEDILNVLLDVEWVVGSFVADATGQLLLHQMPPEAKAAPVETRSIAAQMIVRIFVLPPQRPHTLALTSAARSSVAGKG